MLKLKFQYFGQLMQRTNSLEKTLILGKIEGGRIGEDREWDGWMASLTQWTWVCESSRSWWWTGKPDTLQSMGSQRVGHNWATKLKGTFHAKMGTIEDGNDMDLIEAEDISRKSGKNSQKKYTKNIWMTQVTQWSDHSPRARHSGVWSHVGLRKHRYELSQWRWWNSCWAISSPKRWCC